MNPTPTLSVDARLAQLTRSLDELKAAYELYFSGQLRIEPAKEHAAWKRDYLFVQNLDAKSTGQKFRLRNLQSRYTQLSSLWSKVCKQIEEGTYRREKFLGKIKETTKTPPPISKSDALVQSIYKKLSEASSKAGAKIPSAQEFSSAISKEIKKFKELHPKSKMEVKIIKDKTGNFKVQLKAQEKK